MDSDSDITIYASDQENEVVIQEHFENYVTNDTNESSESSIIQLSPENSRSANNRIIYDTDDEVEQQVDLESANSNTNPVAPLKREHESDSETEPSKKKRCRSSDDEDDGKLCPICLDVWSNSGDHRVCSLRCGHLFGHSCLLRWLDSHMRGKKTCPTCKRRVTRNDVRFIYVKKLIALDTTEIDKMKTQLDNAIEERNKLQMEVASLTLLMEQRVAVLKGEIDCLRRNIGKQQQQSSHVGTLRSGQQGHVSRGGNNEPKLYMEKSLEINREGGCRVLDYNKNSDTVAVSMSSPNPLFAGFGVRKITLGSYRPTAFIPLHSKQVRDLAYHSQNEWLLSVSLDKQAKLVDMSNNTSISTFGCESPLWSCCWDSTNPNHFYTGGQQGGVIKFDVRNSSEPLTVLEITGDLSPVVSLASMGWSPGDSMQRGALLCCKLNSCWAFENTSDETYRRHALALEGPFVSMSYDDKSKHVLVSARPNQRHNYSRHKICTLELDSSSSLICNTVHTFQGALTQKLLSRSCMLNVSSDVYVAAHHETHRNVAIWSVNSGHRISSVPAHLPVLDLCSVPTGSGYYLASLNEKKLDFYKIEL